MAFYTWNLLVHACQRVFRRCMTEFGGGFKGIEVMAILAGCGNGLLVVVGMAGSAGCIQSQVSEFFAFDLDIGNELSLMAVPAFLLRVGAG